MKKVNGFTRTTHPFQIITYIFFSGCIIIYFLITFPLSSNAERIVGAILEVVFGAGVAISGYIATKTDTSDSLVQEQKRLKKEGKEFSHIKSDFHCSWERAFVKEGSKHCKRCGRCTEGFDHHCKWINNCIGKKNYKAFVTMIFSVFLFLATFLIFGAIVTARYAKHSDFSVYNIWIFPHSTGNITGGMVILWIFMGLSILFGLLDLNLVLFHIFLIRKGLTTFQYITWVEERKEYKRELEIALKVMGEKKKTRLDFILCLNKKKKKNRTQTASAPSLTPGENVEDQKDNSNVKKNGSIQLGKSKDLENGLMENEMAEKKTALEFYPKSRIVSETYELLNSPMAANTNKNLTDKNKQDEIMAQKPTSSQEIKKSKASLLQISIPDKSPDRQDRHNESFHSKAASSKNDVDELHKQEHINDVKNEGYEVDHDHHMHQDDLEPNLNSGTKTMQTPVKVRVNASGNDSNREGARPLDSRHNNYITLQDSDGKPSFFTKEKNGDIEGTQPNSKENMETNHAPITKFEVDGHEFGSKINTYKEVDDHIAEDKIIDKEHEGEEEKNRLVTEDDGTHGKGLKKRGSKELQIEVIA